MPLKKIWNLLAIAPVLIAVLAETFQARSAEAQAIAVDQSNTIAQATSTQVTPAQPTAPETMAQVTSVSQLSDVQPTDWAFTALQSLVERYGCIAGYPNRTYLGNRALSRYEFAAGLNACLDRLNELIASSTANLVTQEDLATLQRLQTEYATELTTLRGRVDSLEARTATLEAHQFSTTTKLEGEAVFLAADVFGADAGKQNNTVLQDRVDLDLVTSFTGSDRLLVQLEAGNVVPFNTPTADSNFGSQTELADEADTGNKITLNQLEYVFPLNDAIQISVEGTGGSITDIASSISPLDDDAQGGLSYFSYNPIYDIGGQSTGVGANIQLNDTIDIAFGYLAGEADNPTPGSGLFNGSYAAFGQLTLTPGSFPLTLGLTYVNAFSKDPATVSNAYGLEANYELSKSIEIGGWVGYIDDRVLSDPAARGDGRTWTYAGTLLFHNVGRAGNNLGFIVGVPPRQAEFKFANPDAAGVGSQQEDAALHVEAFYTYQLNDSISITPGVIWLMDPGNNNSNSDIVVGAIRTTFSF